MANTGKSQRTLDRFNRWESLLSEAGIKTEYDVTDDQVVLKWERARDGSVVECGHLSAIMRRKTGNLRFCGGSVFNYGVYHCGDTAKVRTYREASSAVSHAVDLASWYASRSVEVMA